MTDASPDKEFLPEFPGRGALWVYNHHVLNWLAVIFAFTAIGGALADDWAFAGIFFSWTVIICCTWSLLDAWVRTFAAWILVQTNHPNTEVKLNGVTITPKRID